MNPLTTDPATPDRTARFAIALRLLSQDRAACGEYRPSDEPLVAAWQEIQERCAADRTRAADHIDRFLRTHLDDLHDLALRARDGQGPTSLLDRIERAVLAVA